jgi:hypothetical protein
MFHAVRGTCTAWTLSQMTRFNASDLPDATLSIDQNVEMIRITLDSCDLVWHP